MFSNPFRNPYTGRPRPFPANTGFTLFFLAILVMGVISFYHLTEVTNDCDRRGGVVVKNYYDMPECVAGPSRLPPK